MHFKSEKLLQALEKYAKRESCENKELDLCVRSSADLLPRLHCRLSSFKSAHIKSPSEHSHMSMRENCVTWKSRNIHSSVWISAAWTLWLSEHSWRSVTRERHLRRKKHVLASNIIFWTKV